LTFTDFSGKLYPVSERNTMNMNTNEIVHPIDNGQVTTDKVLVSCCGCGEELRISREEANEWTDTDWFQCHECE